MQAGLEEYRGRGGMGIPSTTVHFRPEPRLARVH